jgi:hypothetical protein
MNTYNTLNQSEKSLIRASLYSELKNAPLKRNKNIQSPVFLLNNRICFSLSKSNSFFDLITPHVNSSASPLVHFGMDNVNTDSYKPIEGFAKEQGKFIFIHETSNLSKSRFIQEFDYVLSVNTVSPVRIEDLLFTFETTKFCEYIRLEHSNFDQLKGAISNSFAIIGVIEINSFFSVKKYKEVEKIIRDDSNLTFLAFTFVENSSLQRDQFILKLFNFYDENMEFERIITVRESASLNNDLNISESINICEEILCKNTDGCTNGLFYSQDDLDEDGLCGDCVDRESSLSYSTRQGFEDNVFKLNDW